MKKAKIKEKIIKIPAYNCDACMAYMSADRDAPLENMDILKQLNSIKDSQMKESFIKLIQYVSSTEKAEEK